MEAKTAKQEAMTLLALDYDTLSWEQKDRLQLLTALQAGYTLRTGTARAHDKDWTVYWIAKPDGSHVEHGSYGSDTQAWSVLDTFAESVDACLLLPVPDVLRWCLWVNPTGQVRAALVEVLRDAFSEFDDQEREFKTLPLAMLYQFWTVDDEDDED